MSDIMLSCKKTFSVTDINSEDYMKEVKRIILNRMDVKLSKIQYAAFCARYRKNGGKKYRKPDANYDAWMCIRGESRDIFDIQKLINKFPSIKPVIYRIRTICDVRLQTEVKK